jgi:hypothetical protein
MKNTTEIIIKNLSALGERLRNSGDLEQTAVKASLKNPWFVPRFVDYALNAVIDQMLSEANLRQWLGGYEVKPIDKTIGLIFAGNIPLVGFHDFLCCYVTGCKMKIRLSGKDDVLFSFILKELESIDTALQARVEVVETLKGFDAVIATGSDNTNRSFEYYFRNYPKILRKNRNSVAILTGSESPGELDALNEDIFLYFGFGCRNVSKIYVPAGYDFVGLFPHFERYAWLHNENKYLNNYDYNRTLLLLNKTPHFSNDFVMLTENQSIASPISMVYYEYWHDEKVLNTQLKLNADKIQCIVSSNPGKWTAASSVQFGQSQHPALWDYADSVDTIRFLLNLQ